ncbi:MAG: hypothetical protein V4694_00925 [Pseudomonadota bacterium]
MKPSRPLIGVASEAIKTVFNYVGRDHVQGAFRNGQVATDKKALHIATQFDSLNQNGPRYFGKYETGGQEYGSQAMNFTNPLTSLRKVVKAMPNGTKLRSLTRGGYGNSVVSINPDDLEPWLQLVDEATEKRTVSKVFDYNTNLDELEHCVETLKKLGAQIEIAVPHSPEESYQPFFAIKVEEAAKFAAKHGADLSIKRMVTGLNVEEAKRLGEIVFPIALKYGIKSVGLHAHGDVPEAVAEFMKAGIDHGIIVNSDFVHKGSGPTPTSPGTFPNFYDIREGLAKRGVTLNVSEKQVEILGEIDRLQQERDKSYVAVRAGGAWSEQDKIDMGMPDGGESYSVEAIEKSRYSKMPGMTPELSRKIFKVYYIEFRERFAKPTSVTPGHKRIETGAIYAIEKTIDEVLAKDGFDMEKIAKSLKAKSHAELYSDMSPEIVDAFRNNKLPLPLSEDALKFLCSENMKNTLKQEAFNGVAQVDKDRLIEMAHDSEAVAEESQRLIRGNILPLEVLIGKGEKFNKLSLVQASGERKYLESAKAPKRYEKCFKEIAAKVDEGANVPEISTAAKIAAALTGGETVYVNGTYRGPKPSAENLTIQEYAEATKKFYTDNLVVLKSGKKADLPKSEELLKMATDGYFSGSVINEDGLDLPASKVQPLGKESLVQVQNVRAA